MWVQELSGSLNAVSKLAHQCWNQDISLASAWVTNSFGNQKVGVQPKSMGLRQLTLVGPRLTSTEHIQHIFIEITGTIFLVLYQSSWSMKWKYLWRIAKSTSLCILGEGLSFHVDGCSASWNLKLGPRTFRKQKQLQKNSLMTAECWKKGKFQFCNDVTAGVADRELRIKLKNETSVA